MGPTYIWFRANGQEDKGILLLGTEGDSDSTLFWDVRTSKFQVTQTRKSHHICLSTDHRHSKNFAKLTFSYCLLRNNYI